MTNPASLTLLVLGACLAACGGSPQPDTPVVQGEGQLLEKPGGGYFLVDTHHGGRGTTLRLVESLLGRLVDVHDVDALGVRSALPVLRDLPVRPELGSDGLDYRLETDLLTQRARLVVLHTRGSDAFEDALRRAASDLPRLEPRGPDSSGPFSGVARNAAVVLRFDDLLEDGPQARFALLESVRVQTGYAPRSPFAARVLFDPSHGGLVRGAFHSTRVVVDPTVSAADLENDGSALAVNLVGFPASLETSPQANLVLRVPTRVDPGAGQFDVLRGLSGHALDPLESGPVDLGTADVVRYLRTGNAAEPSNGLLPDDVPPALLGRWELSVLAAGLEPEAPEDSGALRLDLRFATSCARAPRAGDLLEGGAGLLEVTAAGPALDGTRTVTGLQARVLGAAPRAPGSWLGQARLITPLDEDPEVEPACWIRVNGAAGEQPGTGLAPGVQLELSFSEPMDPASLDPLEGLRLYRGQFGATTAVVARLVPSLDSTRCTLVPLAPLDHRSGQAESYRLELGAGRRGPTDLAGNNLGTLLPPLGLELDPAAETASSGGFALRFASADEIEDGHGRPDLRGAFTYDFSRGVLRPRPVTRTSWPLDGRAGTTSLMFPLPVGVPEPLVPLGSRLQTLWRYADLGWSVEDESRYDVDVEGLAWVPFDGQVNSDFHAGFELRLGHGVQLPDEVLAAPGILAYPGSGLLDAPSRFEQNVLEPGGARVVHARSFGYRIDPALAFRSTSGTLMMPFPLQGGGGEPFTWRDTALQGHGGQGGGGVPLGIEQTLDPSVSPGSVALAGQVPSFGLPLLLEFRVSPSNAVGNNRFRLAVAALGQLMPTWRVHSTGGRNATGVTVPVHPDLAEVPAGGFDPNTGLPTRSGDPTLYLGQLDTVTRLARAYTVWLDTGSAAPDYLDPLVTPAQADLPGGTEIRLDFRGADGFAATQGAELDADRLDPYGEPRTGAALYPGNDRSWSSDIDSVDGHRYLQVRITFVNDVEGGLSPVLDSLAIAFRRP